MTYSLRKNEVEFKTVEKVTGNHFTIFSKNSFQFIDDKEKESMAIDYLLKVGEYNDWNVVINTKM